MSPTQEAALLYRDYLPEEDFFEDLFDYRRTGIVVCQPDCFVMGKAVLLDDGRAAWFIQVAIGRLRELLELFPVPLPCIAFARYGGLVKVYDFDRFLRLANHFSVSASPHFSIL